MAEVKDLLIKLKLADMQIERLVEETERLRRDLKDCRNELCLRPVARGKWEDLEVTYVADKTTLPFERISSMRCNQCNRYHTEIYYYGDPTEMANFCPNCGAMMEES